MSDVLLTPEILNAPTRNAQADQGTLADHPLWSDFLAEITAIRLADREQGEREYVEHTGEVESISELPPKAAGADELNRGEGDRLANHPLWEPLLDEIAANRQADRERDTQQFAE